MKTETEQQTEYNFPASKWQFETQQATGFPILNGLISFHNIAWKLFLVSFFMLRLFRFQPCCMFTRNLATWQESACKVTYRYLCVLTTNLMKVWLVIFVILCCVCYISHCFFIILWFFLENQHITLQIACCILKDMVRMNIVQYLQFICCTW